jgi:hypothetical protein
MMNTSTKSLLSLSLAAALAFGLSACSKDNTPDPTPSPSISSAKPTITASPSASSSASPTPTNSSVPSVSYSADSELKEAQEAFPNLKVNEGEDKEQIQLALLAAKKYVNTAYNSGYLANGSWIKNGGSSQELVKLYGKDWSDSYRLKIEEMVDEFHNGADQAKQDEAASHLILNMLYFTNQQGFTLPEDCNANNIGVSSCLVNGEIVQDGDMTYQANANGNVYVNVNFTANVRFIKDGIQGVSPFKYKVQLEMVKNPYPDAENLRFAYVVNDIGGDWKIETWHEGEK